MLAGKWCHLIVEVVVKLTFPQNTVLNTALFNRCVFCFFIV